MGNQLGVLARHEIASLGIVEPCVDPVREVSGEKVMSYGLGYYGYDIRMGNEFSSPLKIDFTAKISGPPALKLLSVIDPKSKAQIERFFSFKTDKPFFLPPHSFVLAKSFERFNMPEDVIGVCFGKSSYARCDIHVNVTPLEPGWRGILTMCISNDSQFAVRVYPGEGIAQVVFYRGEPIDLAYSGNYQDQDGIRLLGS